MSLIITDVRSKIPSTAFPRERVAVVVKLIERRTLVPVVS